MSRFLLAAEADKIQDLLFRSSRLREVVGGSQLVTRFCEEVPSLLLSRYGGDPKRNLIVHDGGSFRVLFDDKAQARAFGEELAELYRLATGGSLTVADPVEVREGNFGEAVEEANASLRTEKRRPRGWHTPEQMPYMAFCGSCGLGVAVTYEAVQPGEQEYLCASCRNKNAERVNGFRNFLEPFRREMVSGEKELEDAGWPGYPKEGESSEDDPEHALAAIAAYDSRQYVAYLLADGNNMGELFSRCADADQMRRLSRGIGRVIRKALAEPTRELMKTIRNENKTGKIGWIPVWPLIMGGDDLFALIPAPWALDMARRFCEVYEREMAALVSCLDGVGGAPPSVAAAMVICKSKHPYAHAHVVGEECLAKAKRLGKRVAARNKAGDVPSVSTVDFEVILGGKLEEPSEYRKIRPTLRPYLLRSIAASGGQPAEVARTLDALLDLRWELRRLPGKRLSELERVFGALPRDLEKEPLDQWRGTLNRLVERIERFHPPEGKVLTRLIEEPDERLWFKPWRQIEEEDDYWYGHELPDLLKAWDFAYRLDCPRREYEGEGLYDHLDI